MKEYICFILFRDSVGIYKQKLFCIPLVNKVLIINGMLL